MEGSNEHEQLRCPECKEPLELCADAYAVAPATTLDGSLAWGYDGFRLGDVYDSDNWLRCPSAACQWESEPSKRADELLAQVNST